MGGGKAQANDIVGWRTATDVPPNMEVFEKSCKK